MKVFKLLRYVLVSAFLIGGASVVNAQDEDLPEVVYGEDMAYLRPMPYGGTLVGSGTISGAGKIYMELGITDGGYVGGRYYYVKTNKGKKNKAWIYLSGSDTVDSRGYTNTLYLEEENGYFSGTVSRSGTYKGTFYRNDGKQFSFTINLRN